ncbi:NAD-dependent epimerase/dehydratase family protein [Psychroflexus tropicus]|uniref:NAD-dependent epimerase/dehydratase family protein n=1 Tax=Psychroflexus tropicus TaxID=197345 RepID=UPI000360ADEC|nr:NAD-dependent epimerase/dehydratase family protein [Psychroflexus tropicus]
MNLLTGATGLVGAHLLAYLISKKVKTRALFRTENKKQQAINVLLKYDISDDQLEKYIEWYRCDILDLPALELAFEGVTHVYHCAGFISNSPSDYKLMRKVNIEGTAHMVNLSIHFGIEKFGHVSSIATLGKPISPQTEITEKTPLAEDQKPSAYEISKYGAEMEVWRASQEGLKVVILNPGIILGDGFYSTGSGKLLSKMKNGVKIFPPKITGFVGVYDVCKAMIKLMDSNIINERYILVSENLSFYHVMSLFASKFNKPAPDIELKPWMLYITWFFEILRSFFTSYKRQLTLEVIPDLFKNALYSSNKIKNELDFEFEPIEVYLDRIYQRY